MITENGSSLTLFSLSFSLTFFDFEPLLQRSGIWPFHWHKDTYSHTCTYEARQHFFAWKIKIFQCRDYKYDHENDLPEKLGHIYFLDLCQLATWYTNYNHLTVLCIWVPLLLHHRVCTHISHHKMHYTSTCTT